MNIDVTVNIPTVTVETNAPGNNTTCVNTPGVQGRAGDQGPSNLTEVLIVSGMVNTVSGNLISTGINLQNQITSLSGNLLSSGVLLENKINSLSGALNNSGNNLNNLINSLSGSLSSSGQNLDNQIAVLENWTGTSTGIFYPLNSNPSGYIRAVQTGDFVTNSQTGTLLGRGETGIFATAANLESTGLNLQNQINTINTISGGFVTNTVLQATGTRLENKINSLSGSLLISGDLLESKINSLSGLSTNKLTGINVTGSSTIIGLLEITGAGNIEFQVSGQTVWISGNTGAYVNFTNLDNKISSLSGSLNNTGSSLLNEITAIKSWTGTTTGIYYPYTDNPANYVTTSQTGTLLGRGETGIFALNSNLQSTGTTLLNEVNTIKSWTGTTSNIYATIGNLATTGSFLENRIISLSGNLLNSGNILESKINSLSGQVNSQLTGINVTGGNTIVGLVSLTGQGSVTITPNGQNIIISGAAGGAGTPGGSTRQIQFNNNNSFDGSSALLWSGNGLYVNSGIFISGNPVSTGNVNTDSIDAKLWFVF